MRKSRYLKCCVISNVCWMKSKLFQRNQGKSYFIMNTPFDPPSPSTYRADVLNAVYFRQRLTSTLGLTNEGQGHARASEGKRGQARASEGKPGLKRFLKRVLTSLYVDGV